MKGNEKERKEGRARGWIKKKDETKENYGQKRKEKEEER